MFMQLLVDCLQHKCIVYCFKLVIKFFFSDSYRCDSCSNDSEDIENSKQTVDYDASSVFTKLNIISLGKFSKV